MDTNIKNIVLSLSVFLFISVMGIWLLIKSPDKYSETERRLLAEEPELSYSALISGKYMKEFETYTLDQFPMRDRFRMVKVVANRYAFGELVNNSLYMKDGYVSKMEYPLKDEMINYAMEHFYKIYTQYLETAGIKPYIAVVPDKNYYLADRADVLMLDYDKLYEEVKSKADYMNFIDIRETLSLKDYYRTDTHWKQECIIDTAEYIGNAMGNNVSTEYNINVLDKSFYGVYAGQILLPVKPDRIKYLTNETLDNCKVTVIDEKGERESSIYNMDKAYGKDSYEMFLSGSVPLVIIENPNAANDKELIIFRDSFGSSIAPLFVEGYSKVTIVDTRYINSSFIGNFIEFNQQDVLFLYSTLLLNNSMVLN